MSETRPSHHTPEYLDFLKQLDLVKEGANLLYRAVERGEVSHGVAERLVYRAFDRLAEHRGAVSTSVLNLREDITLDKIMTCKVMPPDDVVMRERTAAFAAAHPPAQEEDWRKHDQDYQNYATAMRGTALILGSMGAGILGSYLEQKGVNVTALYGSVLGTALLGHGMNKYEEWRKSRPRPAETAPAQPQYGGFSMRIGAALVALCSVLSMMGGRTTHYDAETAKPHKALHMVEAESAGLLFANEIPR